MCSIAGIIGPSASRADLARMTEALKHRGPDDSGVHLGDGIALGHNRLSILDLSSAGRQPMWSSDGRYAIVFNGEVYNYLEIRQQLHSHRFHTATDTEVILTAYREWGSDCLQRFVGMFAFAIWDDEKQKLFAARDRFGVKPFYYSMRDNSLVFASEIKSFHAIGIGVEFNELAWSDYLTYGITDSVPTTFWERIYSLPASHALAYSEGNLSIFRWYDLPHSEIIDEENLEDLYAEVLDQSIRLRLRSDVPVGVNLSGGLDSGILFTLVAKHMKRSHKPIALTFATGDSRYDETRWAASIIQDSGFEHHVCQLKPIDVPELAMRVQKYQDEPFGGIPTLAYSKLFEEARGLDLKVLLDGQGMDEQWAGYDYYLPANRTDEKHRFRVQASTSSACRPDCLTPEFRKLASPLSDSLWSSDRLQNMQYRDVFSTKIPRAVRFNDRISMMYGIELREPFLDHRLFELAVPAPEHLKIQNGEQKWLLRSFGKRWLPSHTALTPKRPVQTPQREWLRGELLEWADSEISNCLDAYGGIWLDAVTVRKAWEEYVSGVGDNSFYVWQWISLSLLTKIRKSVTVYN